MSGADARSIETTILRALAERGQKTTAAAAGISDTRLSRWKSGSEDGGGLSLPEVADALAALGLRVFPDADGPMVRVPASVLHALYVLAYEHTGERTRGGQP